MKTSNGVLLLSTFFLKLLALPQHLLCLPSLPGLLPSDSTAHMLMAKMYTCFPDLS